MNRIARILFMPALPAVLLFFSLVETPSFAQEPPHQPSQMTLWQARRAMSAALGNTGIRFSPDSFEYDENSKKGPKTVRIDLLTAPAVAAACRSNGCGLGLTYDAGSLPKNKVTSSFLFRSWMISPVGLLLLQYTSSDPHHRLRTFSRVLCRRLQQLAGLCQGCHCAPAHLHPAGRGLAGAGNQAPHP